MELSVNNGPPVSMVVTSAKGWGESTEDVITKSDGTFALLTIPAGKSTLRLKCVRKPNAAVMDVWNITLVSAETH